MSGGDFEDRLADYNTVPERISEFKEKHPDGSLRPLDESRPFWVETIGERTFICYAAAAWRSPDDTAPGVGMAWEPFPGRTPYTRDSELQNAETSAWGRAIVATLAADAKKSIASRDEIENRRREDDLIDRQTVDHLRDRMNALPGPQRAELRDEWGALRPLAAVGGPKKLADVPAEHVELVESLVNAAEARARAAASQTGTGATQSGELPLDGAQQPDDASDAEKASQRAEAEQLLNADPPEDWVRTIIEQTSDMKAEAVDEELRNWTLPKGGNLNARRKRLAIAMVRDVLRPPK